jgi:DNA-binding PadR family transcriptional regulator
MPKHKPIKFETTLEPNLKEYVSRIIKENPKAKNALKVTLGIIAMGGILTFGAAFPALLGEIGKIRQRQKRESYEKYQRVWRNFKNLKKQRMLDFVKEEDGRLVYQLNKKGKEKIRKFVFDELKINEPKEWDGKWRLVIFDIPEKYKKNRNALRNKLKDMGFYQCQKSAWIHPFDCVEEIGFTKDVLNMKPFVKLFVVEEMDDGNVLYHFKDIIR